MVLTLLLAILAAALICGLIFLYKFPSLSSSGQVFTDIIIETLAKTGANKSAELSLFRRLCILGILICFVVTIVSYIVMYRKNRLKSQTLENAAFPTKSETGTVEGQHLPLYCGILIFPFLLHLLIFGQWSLPLAAGLVFFVLLLFFAKKLRITVSEGLLTPVIIYYALLAFLTVCFHFTDRFSVSNLQLYGTCAFLSLLLLLAQAIMEKTSRKINPQTNTSQGKEIPYQTNKNTAFLRRTLLLLQCAHPLLLALYFVDTYRYQGELLRVPYAPFYYVFFGGLILVLLVLCVLHVNKNWRMCTALPVSKLISLSTVISVFIYNSFSAAPMFAQPDQHHHGEQMIPWQQIVSLGQSAYEEYTPVSGLFPMVNGFIQNVLLGGTVSDYSPAISMMMVLFCIVTITLVYAHTGGGYALLFAIFFALPSYNRQYMVLPVLLLLFLPGLLEKPSLWLKVWLLSGLAAGLYYPLYGAAVIAGTLPLGCYMFFRFIKESRTGRVSGDAAGNNTGSKAAGKNGRKSAFTFTKWALCLLPVTLCVPLLLRMAAHTLTYSGQTVLADGIALAGQTPPGYFLPYLTGTHASLRGRLYSGYRFFLPMLAIWLFASLFFLLMGRTLTQRSMPPRTHSVNGSKKLRRQVSAQKSTSANSKTCEISQRTILLLALPAGLLTLAVSYTYTLVRADVNVILSRTAPILIAVCGMFLPVILISAIRKCYAPFGRGLSLLILGISFSLPLMIYQKVAHMKFPDMWTYPNGEAALIMDDTDKLYSCYEVPETFVKMSEIQLPDTSMLGDGFMVADQIGYLEQYETVMQKCEAAVSAHSLSDTKRELSYMGFDGQGFYYYVNARACSTGFIQAGKGYDAQQEILSQVKEKRPVIFLIEPQSSYYVYYWMMTNDYVYVAEDEVFYPLELYCLVYDADYTTQTLSSGSVSQEDAQQDVQNAQRSSELTLARRPALLATGSSFGDDYRKTCPATDFGLVASSFGASYDSLKPLFTDSMKISLQVQNELEKSSDHTDGIDTAYQNTIRGTAYDFLYLEWNDVSLPENAKTLSISFTCDGNSYEGACVTCSLTGADLLIPMGMNGDWLLSENSAITVTLLDASGDGILQMPLAEFAGQYCRQATWKKLSQSR